MESLKILEAPWSLFATYGIDECLEAKTLVDSLKVSLIFSSTKNRVIWYMITKDTLEFTELS